MIFNNKLYPKLLKLDINIKMFSKPKDSLLNKLLLSSMPAVAPAEWLPNSKTYCSSSSVLSSLQVARFLSCRSRAARLAGLRSCENWGDDCLSKDADEGTDD